MHTDTPLIDTVQKSVNKTTKSTYYKIGESPNFNVYLRLWNDHWEMLPAGRLPIAVRLRFETKSSEEDAVPLANFDFGDTDWTGQGIGYVSFVGALGAAFQPGTAMEKAIAELDVFGYLLSHISTRFPAIKMDMGSEDFAKLCTEILLAEIVQGENAANTPPPLAFKWAMASHQIDSLGGTKKH